MDNDYGEAAVEVLDILEHTKKEDVDKISKKFINFLKEQSSKTYQPNLDYTKQFFDMELHPKTYALLGIIYLKYWGNEEEKEIFQKQLQENEKQYQKELTEKYSIDNLFDKRQTNIMESINEQTQLPEIIHKENFIQKIINKIRKIFNKGGK